VILAVVKNWVYQIDYDTKASRPKVQVRYTPPPSNQLRSLVMRKNPKKNSTKSKYHAWKIAAIATLFIGLFASSAKAINVQQWTSTVLTQLKGNVEKLTKISQEFSTSLQNVTGITETAIAEITGQMGQLDPSTAKKKIEEEAGTDSPIGVAIRQGSAAAATSANAGDKVLRKESQKADKEKIDNLVTTADESIDFANSTVSIGEDAQTLSSSQDVLKALARQNSNRAKIEAAQVQIALATATDAQQVKEQLAASNQSIAEGLKQQQGERQKRLIIENEQSQSSIKSQYNNMVESGL
jgi:hypothetical protein